MGQIQIEIFEFALLVSRPGGITVLFPEVDHALTIRQGNGEAKFVARGADLEVRGPGGGELDPAPTTKTAEYQQRVVNVNEAEEPKLYMPGELLDPATPPDRDLLNGRLFLKGGTIHGVQCSKSPGPFQFKLGRFVVTDTAMFTLDIPDGESFVLSVNGEPSLDLNDGSLTRISNHDVLGCPKSEFQTLAEFVKLCGILGHSATLPTGSGGFKPMGFETICLIAQMEAP
jgi:hypothetical protein